MTDETPRPDLKVFDEGQHRAALVRRTLPVLLIPALAALVMLLVLQVAIGPPPPPPPDSPFQPPPLVLRMAVEFAVPLVLSSILLVLLRAGLTNASALILVGVWTLSVTVGALSSGVMSFWPASLVVPICAAALLLNARASVGLAALATLLIVGSVGLESQGLSLSRFLGPLAPLFGRPPLPPPPEFLFPPAGIAPPRPDGSPVRIFFPLLGISYWVGLFWTVAALTSLLAGSLQRALAQSRAQAGSLSELSASLEERVAAQTAELAQRAARAEALYEVTRALTNTLDLPRVLALITEQAARVLRFDAALVLLGQDPDRRFTLVSAYQEPAGLVPLLGEHEDTLHAVPERRQSARLHLPAADGAGMTALVLPMVYGASVAGVLVLVERGNGAERSPDELALAEGFASQAAVAIANARLLAQARESATLEERARLAREIHDTLAQGLTGVVVQLGAARRALAAAPAAAEEHLGLAQRLARESLAEARRSVWNLRAPALAQGDLGDALRGLVARPLTTDTAAEFEQVGEPWPLPPRVESALLRVCQEALVNVAKHARATTVVVRLEYTPAAVWLTVQDNGVGFDEAVLRARAVRPDPGYGFGLLGMRERLAALHGTLELTNRQGARVQAMVPRAGAGDAAPAPSTDPAVDAGAAVLARGAAGTRGDR